MQVKVVSTVTKKDSAITWNSVHLQYTGKSVQSINEILNWHKHGNKCGH